MVPTVELATRRRPDVVLMDVRMPVMDGIEATRRIAADPALGAVKVVVLTTFELDEYVFEGLRAGASGFLLKDTDAAELLRAIRVVAGGDALLTPKVTRRLIAEFAAHARPAPAASTLDILTARERQITTLVAGGLSNGSRHRLFLSTSTAKTHVARAMTSWAPGTGLSS